MRVPVLVTASRGERYLAIGDNGRKLLVCRGISEAGRFWIGVGIA